MHMIFTKIRNGHWCPGNNETEEFDQKTKPGVSVHADFKKMRNAAFHRKLFALLNLGFEYWTPGEIDSKFGTPEKNFDRYRKDATILAGFYHNVIRLDGSTRVEADSISFSKMDNEQFEALYNAILNVLLKYVPMLAKMGEDEIDKLTGKLLEFG